MSSDIATFHEICVPFQYKHNVIHHVHPELHSLYNWLEVEFHPLKLSDRIAAPLKFIGSRDDLSQYVSALQNIVITRLIKQVNFPWLL